MSLSLIDLAVVIELVEEKLHEYKLESRNPKNPEKIQDEYSELIAQLGITAGNLQDEYEEQYSADAGRPSYNALVETIRSRFPKSA